MHNILCEFGSRRIYVEFCEVTRKRSVNCDPIMNVSRTHLCVRRAAEDAFLNYTI